jgi:sugar phosphate isomerase/epimerase
LELGKEIGLDGVEVDMGSLGDREDMKNALRSQEVRQQFLDASKKLNVEICSLALSAFYGHSYADHEKSDALTAEWIDIMQKMGVKVGFLPLLSKGDVKENPENRRKTIERLRKAAPSAEKAGVVIGVETNLDADGHKRFLDDVGSPAVRVYYNLGRMLAAGYDIYHELRDLGRDRVCQIHCKEGEVWLGNGLIDFPKVKSALDDIGWSGWLVVERSRMPGKSVVENYTANARYLKSVFQTGA